MKIPFEPLDLSESANDITKKLASGLAENVGATLADCWFLVFGGIGQKASIRRLQYAHDLELFKQELSNKAASIPSNKVIEPDFQSVTQALDASKYCISVPELRHMFSSLIANTLNFDLSNYVSPTFPNILRQMNAYDARLFDLIRNFNCRPLVNYLKKSNTGNHTILENITLAQEPFMDFELQSLSLSTLQLLGLVSFSHDCHAVGITDLYYDLENNPYIYNLKKKYEKTSYEIIVEKGICSLTPLGKSFAKVCLDPKQFPPLFS